MGDHSGGGNRIGRGRFLSFATDTLATDFMDREYGVQTLGLDGRTRDALRRYTKTNYNNVNRYLRSDEGRDPRYDTWITEDVWTMDDAFANSDSVLRHDLKVWRNFGNNNEQMLKLQVGDTFTDRAFVSTTTHRGWFDLERNPFASALEIRVRKGTRAVWLAPLSSEHRYESELLLDRGTTFRVVAKRGAVPILAVVGQRA